MSHVTLSRHTDATQTFRAGEVIFNEGDQGTVMYVVTSGEIGILKGGALIDVARPGSIVGEMALIDKAPRSASAVARTDCTLTAITAERFTFLVQQTPYFALQVMGIMADRLRRSHGRS